MVQKNKNKLFARWNGEMGHMSVCKRENKTMCFCFCNSSVCVVCMHVFILTLVCPRMFIIVCTIPILWAFFSFRYHLWFSPPCLAPWLFFIQSTFSSLCPPENKKLSATFVQTHTESLPYTYYFITALIQVKHKQNKLLTVKRELWAAVCLFSLVQSFDLPIHGIGPRLFLHTALEFHKVLYWLSCYSFSLFLPFSLHPSIHPDLIWWSKGDHGRLKFWHTIEIMNSYYPNSN